MKRTHDYCMRTGLVMVVALGSMAQANTVIETVPVGNPGNVENFSSYTGLGYGKVEYAYNIGKYEVTAGQYTAFLNAVAATDTYGLYNTNMWSSIYGCHIQQSGSSGSYSYSVSSDYANRPVNCVSFWDACRFANWLSNGQPTGPQDASTTEDGTYTLTPTGMANNTITRNSGATWAVTSDLEWYKAAYYDPATSSYYQYPTGSNTPPGQDMTDVSGNNANYKTDPQTWPIDDPYYITLVGEFQNSASPYGTFDQGGNVREWIDTIFGQTRGLRGGGLGSSANELLYYYGFGFPTHDYPTAEFSSYGFRISQVPEPASLAVLMLGGVTMLMRRRGAGK